MEDEDDNESVPSPVSSSEQPIFMDTDLYHPSQEFQAAKEKPTKSTPQGKKK